MGSRQSTSQDAPPAKRILTVDDNPVMRATLRAMLRTDSDYRWEVVEATSGPDFLLALSLHAPFDVVSLDVQMPGMDGFAACRALRDVDPLVPVLFLTAEGDPASYIKGRVAGGDSYLCKPFSASGLMAALHVLVSLKRRVAN